MRRSIGGLLPLLACIVQLVTTQDACAAPTSSVSSVTSAQTAPTADMGVKRALLIGINGYQAVPELQGAVNDVAVMRQLLLTRWGFEPEHITTLTEKAATRTAILSALRQLVSESGPHDVVFVHYSGHGSQVQDLNGDEADGLDETLVPYDGRTPGVPDIVDDELDEIFSHLRTTKALIVLDSCHSGTATRAVEFLSRGVPQDLRIDLYPHSSDGTRAIVPRVQSRLMVMSSAAENQTALDGPIEGEYHGVFTYALVKTLSNAPTGATPRDIFSGVEQEMTRIKARLGLARMSDPQLEGPPELIDQPLLANVIGAASAAVAPRLGWLAVQEGTRDQITLVNGALQGAAVGSIWAIYPPGESQFMPASALGTVKVSGRSGPDATASLQSGHAKFAPAARAVLLMSDPAAQRVPIRLIDIPASQLAHIASLLKQRSVAIEIVGADRPARFILDSHEQGLRLMSADRGEVLATFDTRTDQWGAELTRVLSRSAATTALFSLDNPTSRLTVHASVQGIDTGSSRDIVLVAKTQPVGLHIRRPDEPRTPQDSLQLAVTVSAPAYLTIVDVDTEGKITVLFPNSAQRDSFLPAGLIPAHTAVLIPDSLAAGARAGFFWDYAPPAGLDTLRVFASTDLATAQLIRNRIQELKSPASGRRSLDASEPESNLEPLREDLTALATRGITVVADHTGAPPSGAASPAAADWNAVSLTIAVSR